MIYPLPAVLVTCADKKGNSNIITIAWTGTVCSDPSMLYISVRKERYSHGLLTDNGEFVINLTTEQLTRATDYCGVRSGRDVDKWKEMKLTPEKAFEVSVPIIKESPVNIECRVKQVFELGSHDMFLAEVLCVDADEAFFDKNDRLDLGKVGLMAYVHGEYYSLGQLLGSFGYSVKKKSTKKKPKSSKKQDGKTSKPAARKKPVIKKSTPKTNSKKK